MLSLDMKTILAGYIVSSALCAGVMTSLWLQNRDRSPEISLWLVDYVLQFVGILLIGLRGIVPDFVSIVLANAFIVGGTVVLYRGLERYVGRETRQLHNYAMLALFTTIHAYLTFVHPSLALRNVNLSLALAFITVQAAWLMLRRVELELRPATIPTGVVFSAFTLAGIVRAVLDLAGPRVNDVFESGVSDSAAILVDQTLYVALTFALFLLVSRRLLMALEEDAAQRTATEDALRHSEEKFSVAFHNIPDAIVISRIADGRIVEANETCSKMTGFAKEEMLGKTTTELNLWDSVDDRERLVQELEQRGRASSFECVLRRKNGAQFSVVASGEVIEVGGERSVLTVIHDATESKLAEERLKDLSNRDPLTGLLNYRAFHAVAYERLATVSDSRVAILFMDLDRLKSVNDEYGHAEGDSALVIFADALRAAFRESDVIGRVGGDEFTVLAVSRESVSDESLLARFRDELHDRNTSAGLPYEISASVGVAWWEPSTGPADLEDLIRTADVRMYEAKRAH